MAIEDSFPQLVPLVMKEPGQEGVLRIVASFARRQPAAPECSRIMTTTAGWALKDRGEPVGLSGTDAQKDLLSCNGPSRQGRGDET